MSSSVTGVRQFFPEPNLSISLRLARLSRTEAAISFTVFMDSIFPAFRGRCGQTAHHTTRPRTGQLLEKLIDRDVRADPGSWRPPPLVPSAYAPVLPPESRAWVEP